jgi:hypothetical protein
MVVRLRGPGSKAVFTYMYSHQSTHACDCSRAPIKAYLASNLELLPSFPSPYI